MLPPYFTEPSPVQVIRSSKKLPKLINWLQFSAQSEEIETDWNSVPGEGVARSLVIEELCAVASLTKHIAGTKQCIRMFLFLLFSFGLWDTLSSSEI